MRKIVMLNRISIDGFFAGPNGEIDWFIHDPEVDQAVHEIPGAGEAAPENQPGMLLAGRITYQMFESYWPQVARDPNAPEGARKMADELNQMTKVVFSKTLPEVTWENSKLVRGNVAEEARRLKQGQGSDILIFGSGTIVQQLVDEGLIDDYLIIVTPVVMGAGQPLFKDAQKLNLELVEARGFKSGNVLLHYRARQ